MSLVMKLMIGGWATTLAMIGVCALNESGKLFKIRKRIASWLEPSDATNSSTADKAVYPRAMEVD
jgi:hypothetical protein